MAELVCEICGKTSAERSGWNDWCPIHLGWICERCCYNCKYMHKIGSLVHCSFRDGAQKNNRPEEGGEEI